MSGAIEYQMIENRLPCAINLKEVKYFKSVDKIVNIHMKNGDIHTFRKTKSMNALYREINSLYPVLTPLNVSYIVDINIVELKNKIAFFDGRQTKISDKYLSNFKEIQEFKGLSLPL